MLNWIPLLTLGIATAAFSINLLRRSNETATRWFILSIVFWFLLATTTIAYDFFNNPVTSADFFPGFVLLATLMTAGLFPILFYIKSKVLRQALLAVNLKVLIAMQFYRIGGLVFISAALVGSMPTYYGLFVGTFDLIVAFSSIFLIAVGTLKYRTIRLHSIVGISDFVIAITWYALMFPLPVIGNIVSHDNSLHGLGAWPLSFIALYAVPISICLHLLTIEKAKIVLIP